MDDQVKQAGLVLPHASFETDGTLARALAAAQVGTWSYDRRTERESWDATTKALFGIAGADEPTTGLFLSIVHPDDRRHYAQAYAAAIDPAGTGRYGCDFRIRRPDTGEERWLSSRGQSEFVDGRFIRLIGVVQDVTEQKRAEARLRERELQLAQFIEDAPVAIAMFDTEMRYIAVSRRYSVDFRTPPPQELIGRLHYEVMPDIPDRWIEIDKRVLAGEELSADEDPFPRAGGGTDWVRWSMKPWRDAEARIGGALIFSEIVTDEVEARHAVSASEQRFRSVFENAATGIALVGLDGTYEQCNPAFSRMTGFSEDELRRMNMRSLMHPDDLPALLEKDDRLIAGEIPSFEITNRYVCKDGNVRWTRRFISMLHDRQGRPQTVMVLATDMTERIAYEQKIGLLLREVSHRAKNMLGVVQAIARSTAASGAEDFQLRFAERIRALAAAHDLLVQNEWQSVEVSDLVASQLAIFTDMTGGRIVADGPSLKVSGAAAQTLGMAIHELAANAFKFGALSTDTGRVAIAWQRDGDRFRMDWSESGGPPAPKPVRSGFGSIVLDRMTRMSLGGTIDLDWSDRGFGWHLSCPLDKIAPKPMHDG